METTKAYKTETVIDVATRIYGHATGVFWLLEDNPGLSLGYEFSEDTDLKKKDEKIKLLTIGGVPFKVRKKLDYQLGTFQGFFDVCIENQGHVEGAFDLVKTNSFDGFTEHLFEADVLKILASAHAPRMRDSLKRFMPIATVFPEDKSDGIGWMIIEKNFIVR